MTGISVNGLTAEFMTALSNANIVGAAVVSGHLILTTRGGATIDAGPVIGPKGDTGDIGSGSPAGGGLQGTYPNPDVKDASLVLGKFDGSLIDAASGASLRSLGNTSTKAAPGDHNHYFQNLLGQGYILSGAGRLQLGDLLFQWGSAASPTRGSSTNADTWTFNWPISFGGDGCYQWFASGADGAPVNHAARGFSPGQGTAYSWWTDGTAHATHGTVRFFAIGHA